MLTIFRHFLRAAAASLSLFVVGTRVSAQPLAVTSPDGSLRAEVSRDAAGALCFSVVRDGETLFAPARIGVTVDEVDLGAAVQLGDPQRGVLDETYSLFGGKSAARNHAATALIPILTATGRPVLHLEVRAYDDGVAWRAIAPADETTDVRRVSGEVTSWRLPEHSRIWYFERNSDWKLKSYAGEWVSAPVDQLPTVSSQGPVQGTPLVVELADGKGYALLTEAALDNYSGLRLRALPGRLVQADFGEGTAGFTLRGQIITPWRVTLVAHDLDALVNSTLVTNLCPPPDAQLYADTSYLKPGRAVWRWWSADTGTPAQERAMIEAAAELGFEYTLVDDGWKNWPNAWDELRSLVRYGRERAVGVFIWKDYKDVASPADGWADLRRFLDDTAAAGVVGVKLDFLNAETKDRIDFVTAALRLAAARRLMVVFHGVAKPTGEARTYPNEITREGIRGLELNRMKEGPIPASHNAALPYTRFVVGPGDYTPLGYSRPGATTWTHQLATLVQFTSPLQVIAEHPDKLLRDPATQPALDVLKAIPSAWDETRVLPPSRIGELSVIARRKGADWFLSVLTGAGAAELEKIDLAFLGAGEFAAVELTSPERTKFARREVPAVSARTPWRAKLAEGDGLVVWFKRLPARAPEVQARDGVGNFQAKAQAGGTVKVAYLGGSITAANGWRVGTRAFLQRRYPNAKMEEIFAAISGTPSTLGVARLQMHVLAHQPDLLFVEFAVNDGALDPERIERAYEGIVRQTWAQFPRCDIVFVYTLSQGMVADYRAGRLSRSAQAMERVAAHYGIPTIAFGFEVVKRIDRGEWVFVADKQLGTKDKEGRTIFTNDATHPTEAGHALYTEVVARHWPAFEHTDTAKLAPHKLGPPLRADHWAQAGFLSLGELPLGSDWQPLAADDERLTRHAGRIAPRTWRSERAGNSFECVVSGTVIGLLGFKNENSSFFRVTIDDLPPVEGSFRDQPLGPQHRLKSWFDQRTHAPGPHHVRVEQISGADTKSELLVSGVLYSGEPAAPEKP